MSVLTVRNLESVCYVLIYLRYVKDNSIANAVLAVLVIFISRFITQMVALYDDRSRVNPAELEHGEELSTIFKMLMRSLRYYQTIYLLHFLSSTSYHYAFSIKEDVCSWKHGYFFTDFIGEFDCGRGGKPAVFILDLGILLLQLLAFNESFSKFRRSSNGPAREISLEGFETHKYGILSILRFDSFGTEATELKAIEVRDDNVDDPLNSEGYGSIV